jgi:mannan endo-1,6-alpha-mannosidase
MDTYKTIESIKSTASTIAKGLVASYQGTESGHVIGLLESPYGFYEAAFMWDTLIQYWILTGDDQYNSIVSQALVYQQGKDSDSMPSNQSASLGDDDQATWALAALSAAEGRLPDPETTTWITIAENVFNEQVLRWDPATCDGGLRWQIFPYNTGYT